MSGSGIGGARVGKMKMTILEGSERIYLKAYLNPANIFDPALLYP